MTREKFIKTMEKIMRTKRELDNFIDSVYSIFSDNVIENIYAGSHLYDYLTTIEEMFLEECEGWLDYIVVECDGDFSKIEISIDDEPQEIENWDDVYDLFVQMAHKKM